MLAELAVRFAYPLIETQPNTLQDPRRLAIGFIVTFRSPKIAWPSMQPHGIRTLTQRLSAYGCHCAVPRCDAAGASPLDLGRYIAIICTSCRLTVGLGTQKSTLPTPSHVLRLTGPLESWLGGLQRWHVGGGSQPFRRTHLAYLIAGLVLSGLLLPDSPPITVKTSAVSSHRCATIVLYSGLSTARAAPLRAEIS